MLLLGAVQLFEPVNGYQIRRELVSWRVDEWAHINPGSIYSGLETLARAGHLARHPLVEGNRTVTVYTTTDAGRAEFHRLFADAVRTHDRGSARGFTTALSLAAAGRACRCSSALLKEAARPSRRCWRRARPSPRRPPSSCRRTCRRSSRSGTSRAAPSASGCAAWWPRWRPAGSYAGEPSAWVPPEDDPGWAMQADRERYRRALGIPD